MVLELERSLADENEEPDTDEGYDKNEDTDHNDGK